MARSLEQFTARPTVRQFVAAFCVAVATLVAIACRTAPTESSAPKLGSTAQALSGGGYCGDGQTILVVTDTSSSTNQTNVTQSFIGEMLRTEGLSEFSEDDISNVTSTCIAAHGVVLLPSIALTSDQAAIFSGYVSGGGFLIGFRPDQQLATTFGVTAQSGHACGTPGSAPTTTLCTTTPNDGARAAAVVTTPGSLSDCTADTLPTDESCAWCTSSWVQLNASAAVNNGLTTQTMKIHGATKYYTANTGTQTLATLFSDSATSTGYPAVTYYAPDGGGRAALFAYDLAENTAMGRQGNPWLAGANTTMTFGDPADGGVYISAAGQMFRDESTGMTLSANVRETNPRSKFNVAGESRRILERRKISILRRDDGSVPESETQAVPRRV